MLIISSQANGSVVCTWLVIDVVDLRLKDISLLLRRKRRRLMSRKVFPLLKSRTWSLIARRGNGNAWLRGQRARGLLLGSRQRLVPSFFVNRQDSAYRVRSGCTRSQRLRTKHRRRLGNISWRSCIFGPKGKCASRDLFTRCPNCYSPKSRSLTELLQRFLLVYR